MMQNCFDGKRLAELVATKRGGLSLRDVSAQINARENGTVSPATLSRVLAGRPFELDTFLCLCDWLEVPAASLLFVADETPEHYDPEQLPHRVGSVLRSAPWFDPGSASLVVDLVRKLGVGTLGG